MTVRVRHNLCLVIFFVFLVLVARDALPAPPAPTDGVEIDPAMSEFFRSLQSPIYGFSCCDVSDCRRLPSRQVGGGYQVMIDQGWVDVPDAVIIRGRENPVGEAATCYLPRYGIMCFLPGSLT